MDQECESYRITVLAYCPLPIAVQQRGTQYRMDLTGFYEVPGHTGQGVLIFTMGTHGQTRLLISSIRITEILLFSYQRQISIYVLKFTKIEIQLVRQQ
jgi:hypothetical protein